MGGESLTWKVVAEKREPNLLLAGDRTVCEVSANRFARTREGELALCLWR